MEHYNQILPEVTAEASRLERRAEDAEREVEKMKKAEYMEQFVGETFEGIISGVTTWGMYVELPNTIEGMVRVADIPGDYYYFEEESYQMVGERTHKVYKLGQSVRVTVDAVDKILRTIDFVLAEEEEGQTEQIEEQDTLKREEIKQVRDVDFSGRPVSKRGRRKAKLAGKQPAKGKPVSADKKEPAKGKAVPADKKKPAKSKAVSADKKRELQERRAKLEKKEEVEKAFARKVAAKKKAEQVAKEVSKLTRAAKKAAAKRKSLKKAASKQARPVSRRAGRSSGKKK